MLTRKALKNRIDSFLMDLISKGLHIEKAILFGSYAKGNPHAHSDIDLAIWADEFEGFSMVDIPQYVQSLRNHALISVRPYKSGATAEDDPFLEEIIKTGREWTLPKSQMLVD